MPHTPFHGLMQPARRPSMQFQQLNQAFQSDPRRILGQALMQQGASTAPVRTPLQGLGRLSSALVGAYLQRKAGDAQVERETAMTNQIMGMLPENATAGQRAFVEAYPAAFAQLAGQRQFAPTTSSDLATLGDFTGVRTTQTDPITGATSSSIGNLVQRRAAPETFSALSDKAAQALGLDTSQGQKYQVSNRSNKVSQIGGRAPTTTVNMTTAPGSKATVGLIEKISESASSAQQTLGRVDQMLDLLDAGVETGFGEEFLTGMRRVGQLFNPEYQVEEIAGAEAFTANANALIGPLVKQLGSNPTDKDLAFFVTASPTLSKSIEGNRLLLKALKLSQRREIILNEAANDFISKNPTLDQEGLSGYSRLQKFLTEVRNTHPVFTQGGKALVAEYQSITGEDPPDPSAGDSAFDALINQGFITE